MSSTSTTGHGVDGCGPFGNDQKWAMVWFIAIIVIGSTAVYCFNKIDRKMYDTNAEFFDYKAYRENRESQVSMKSDAVDPRSFGDFVSVVNRGKSE